MKEFSETLKYRHGEWLVPLLSPHTDFPTPTIYCLMTGGLGNPQNNQDRDPAIALPVQREDGNPAAHPKAGHRVKHGRTGRRPAGQNCRAFYPEP